MRITADTQVLVLATDAFGGRGGIAGYMQDFIRALCRYRGGCRVHAIPRRIADSLPVLPAGLTYHAAGAAGRFGAWRALLSALLQARRFDLVVCGHILLLPMAWVAALIGRCPLVLVGYGIDVWQPTGSRLRNWLARRADAVIAITQYTADRLGAWLPLRPERLHLLPPCVDVVSFTPGPKEPSLLERYRLEGKRVLLTMARLDSRERYKGVDEILACLGCLRAEFPDLAYLVVGDGDDRPRLEARAAALGVAEQVRFSGWIPDAEKLAHYRLADAFAMPGSGEGFGIVYLEAMACGLPVLASELDGSREAVRQGEVGLLVDPRDAGALVSKLGELLRRPRAVPAGLQHFTYSAFQARLHAALDSILGAAGEPCGSGPAPAKPL